MHKLTEINKYPPFTTPVTTTTGTVSSASSSKAGEIHSATSPKASFKGYTVEEAHPSSSKLLTVETHYPLSSPLSECKLVWPLDEVSIIQTNDSPTEEKPLPIPVTKISDDKPGAKYSKCHREIITDAILSQPDQKAQIQQIYEYYENNYQAYTRSDYWKRNIRRNLSSNKQFVNIRPRGVKKGGKWCVNKDFKESASISPILTSTAADIQCSALNATPGPQPSPKAGIKPKGLPTYAKLITTAIAQQPSKIATTRQIYEYICGLNDCFKVAPQSWRATVRSTLMSKKLLFEQISNEQWKVRE